MGLTFAHAMQCGGRGETRQKMDSDAIPAGAKLEIESEIESESGVALILPRSPLQNALHEGAMEAVAVAFFRDFSS